MIGKLILTHGGLARELLAAAQVISGRLAGIEALSLDWNDTFDEARAKVRAALERLDEGQGVPAISKQTGVMKSTLHKAIDDGRLKAPAKKKDRRRPV